MGNRLLDYLTKKVGPGHPNDPLWMDLAKTYGLMDEETEANKSYDEEYKKSIHPSAPPISNEATMRAPTWGEKYTGGLQSLFGEVAKQPIAKISDLTGETAFQQMADSFTQPPPEVMGQAPLLSGLPMSAYLKGINKKGMFHGLKSDYDMIDREKFDKNDILGDKFHMAEDPEYAGTGYALGETKHHGADVTGANVRRVIPEAKNVLDLVDPNADDISQILAFADDKQRANLINQFKDYRSGQSSFFDQRHYPTGIPDSPATRAVAEKLKISPQGFLDSPFDTIRYNDMANKSFATPVEKTRIKSGISGQYLSPELPKDIRVIRDPNPMRESTPGTGLQVTEHRQTPEMARQNYLKPPKKNKYDDYGKEDIWEEGPNPLTAEQKAKDLKAKEGGYTFDEYNKLTDEEKAVTMTPWKQFEADLQAAGTTDVNSPAYKAAEAKYVAVIGKKPPAVPVIKTQLQKDLAIADEWEADDKANKLFEDTYGKDALAEIKEKPELLGDDVSNQPWNYDDPFPPPVDAKSPWPKGNPDPYEISDIQYEKNKLKLAEADTKNKIIDDAYGKPVHPDNYIHKPEPKKDVLDMTDAEFTEHMKTVKPLEGLEPLDPWKKMKENDINYNSAQGQADLWDKSNSQIDWDNLDPPITRPEEPKLFKLYEDMLPSAPKFSTKDSRLSPRPNWKPDDFKTQNPHMPGTLKWKQFEKNKAEYLAGKKGPPQKFSKEWYKEYDAKYKDSPEHLADVEKVNKTIAANKAEAKKGLTFSSEVAHLEPKVGKTYTFEKPDGKTFTHTIHNQKDMDYLKNYVNDYKLVENLPFGSLPKTKSEGMEAFQNAQESNPYMEGTLKWKQFNNLKAKEAKIKKAKPVG